MKTTRETASAALRVAILFAAAISLLGVVTPKLDAQSGSDPQFRVKIDFNRWHDYDELKTDLLRLEEAFPKFLTYSSVGSSYEGRDMMLMTINNPDTGPENSKAAMYIEANIHGNEIQGGEVCLYTIWYLMENYGKIADVTRLVDERVFYLFPTVNPDGRDYFMDGTGSGARTGHVPVDDDNDGAFDEDGPDDLNGNGVIEQIRKYVPGEGDMRISHLDPRILEPVPSGEKGDWVLLGSEGIDNDGDGRVNEDPLGGYDPNRNWGSNWQPSYIQGGSMDYPFQLPEARAVNDFLMAHHNIAGVQSYHNSGGMILRGPGAQWQGVYPAADVSAYNELGENGARMLPYYRYIVLWSGLYTVHGGFIDWTNDGLGILSFSNELWARDQYFNSPDLQRQQQDPSSPIAPPKDGYFFDDLLELGNEYVEWQAFDHPDFGRVEMGGWKKTRGRVPPRFMNEELAHRNMAFTLYQADQMPLMSMKQPTVERVSGNVYRVRVELMNDRVTPTIMEKAAQNNVVRPDLMTLDGTVEVISAGIVQNKFRPDPSERIDQHDLKRIIFRNGHPGNRSRVVEYLLKGSGNVTVRYSSLKGGTVEQTFSLR
jgi:hypothetical protein